MGVKVLSNALSCSRQVEIFGTICRMAISDDGFLSEEARDQASRTVAEYQQAFHHLKNVNIKGHEFLREIAPNADSPIQVFAVAFFARALSGFQALILLAERGFVSECRVTCRNILEVKFKLGFLEAHKDAVPLFLAEYQRHRIARLENMRDGNIALGSKLVLPDLNDVIEKAKAHLVNKDGTQKRLPNIKTIAEEAGFNSDYLGLHSSFSEAIHSSAAELDDYVAFNEKQQVTGFRYGPAGGAWLVWIVLYAASHLIECIQITARLVAAKVSQIHRFLDKRHKEILKLDYSTL